MKKLKSHIKILPLLLAVVLVFSIFGSGAIYGSGGNWTSKSDTEIFWVKTASSDISNEDLKTQVQLFASELTQKCGITLPISYGDMEDAGANDIILNLDSSSGIAAQGYVLAPSSSNVIISASDADGLFYGCRDLIKQLILSGSVSAKTEAPDVLERGLSLDNGRKYFSVEWIKELIREMSWSNMNCLVLHFSEEMGLGIESKLYPWLAGRDGRLATQGEVATDMRVLSQDEVREIIRYAKLYHVDVMPSLDSPGHMNYIVMKFNEQCANKDYTFTYNNIDYTAKVGSEIGNYWHYTNADGSVSTAIVHGSDASGTNAFAKTQSRGIDISNEIAVAFTRSLVAEYATLFNEEGCTKIDIGGDELLGWPTNLPKTGVDKWKQLDHWKNYAQNRAKAEGKSNWASAVAYDGFLYYMNDMNDLVRSLGYSSVRMWNDDVLRTDTYWTGVVQLNTNVDIWYWDDTQPITNYLNAGYEVYNIIGHYNYLAMKKDPNQLFHDKATPAYIYSEWTPYVFSGDYSTTDYRLTTDTQKQKVLGTALGVWCDYPDSFTYDPSDTTKRFIGTDLYPMIHSHGAKAWDYTVSNSVSYSTFTGNWSKLGSAPEVAVANLGAVDIYEVADLTALQAAVNAYASTDLTYRTQATADAYTAAVNAGQAVLAQDKPEQAAVDAATAAIAQAYGALAYPDPAPLQALVDEAATMVEADYKPETFVIYTNAINEAKEFLKQAVGTYTEAQLNDMITAVSKAKSGLRDVNEVTGESCFISGTFKAETVYVGKTATINMSVIKGSKIKSFQVYNDLGTETELFNQTSSTYKSDRDNYCVMFTATAKLVGQRTYYVYAVYEDGSVSGDCLELTVTIKN